MSFFDKLVNGGVIAIIQHFNPVSQIDLFDFISQGNNSYKTNLSDSRLNFNTSLDNISNNSSLYNNIRVTNLTKLSNFSNLETISEQISVKYYIQVLVYVSGSAVIMTFVGLLAIMKAKFAKKISNPK
jgi:hypothetical protein